MQPHSSCTAKLAEEQRRDRQPTTPKAAKLSQRAQAKEAAAPSVGDGNMTLRHAAKGLNTTDRARKTRARTASRSCFPEKVMFSGKTNPDSTEQCPGSSRQGRADIDTSHTNDTSAVQERSTQKVTHQIVHTTNHDVEKHAGIKRTFFQARNALFGHELREGTERKFPRSAILRTAA